MDPNNTNKSPNIEVGFFTPQKRNLKKYYIAAGIPLLVIATIVFWFIATDPFTSDEEKYTTSLEQANQQLANGDNQAAVSSALKAAEKAPDSVQAVEAYDVAVEAYSADSQISESVPLYEKAVAELESSDPVYPFAVYRLTLAYANTGDFDNTIAQFNKIIELHDSSQYTTMPITREDAVGLVEYYTQQKNTPQIEIDFDAINSGYER